MRGAPFRPDRGLSLVEVTLAVGVIAFCLIVLVGLLPGGLAAVRDGANEEAATGLLATVSLDISQAANPEDVSPVFGVPARSESPQAVTTYCDGGGKVLPAAEHARFRVEITPHDSGNPRLGVWHVTVVCPPQAPPATRPSAETLVTVPRG